MRKKMPTNFGEIMYRSQFDYNERKIKKTKVNGVEVSTAYVPDYDCWETAIKDLDNIYPVERYQNPDLAILGHTKWVDNMEHGVEYIEKLEFFDLTEKEIIKLRRKK